MKRSCSRFLRHDKIFVAEAHLILGEWKIITVLRVFIYGLFIRANLLVFPFVLFGSWLNGIFIVFGIVRSIVFSCAGIAVFSTVWLRAAPLTSVLRLYLLGCIHHVHVV